MTLVRSEVCRLAAVPQRPGAADLEVFECILDLSDEQWAPDETELPESGTTEPLPSPCRVNRVQWWAGFFEV